MERKITIGHFLRLITALKKEKKVTNKTELWLSSDEEGNSYSPLMQFKEGMVNFNAHEGRLTLFPSSMHSEDG